MNNDLREQLIFLAIFLLTNYTNVRIFDCVVSGKLLRRSDMKTTYTTKFMGDEFTITADFGDASCPISGDLEGKQVADFRHSPREAMRSALIACCDFGGDDPDEYEIEIEEALDEMVGRDNDVIEMAKMLESHGQMFTGNNVDDEAQGWIDNGFTPEVADEWCEIGCWDASVAAQLRDAGLTPDDAHNTANLMIDMEEERDDEDDPSEYTDGDPIYSICNGDTKVQYLIDWAKGE